jgi:3-deoxy-alpha-D-manno-octulosonate 8-oxidase
MTKDTLATGISLARNVDRYNFGSGSLGALPGHLEKRRDSARQSGQAGTAVFFIDGYFSDKPDILARFAAQDGDSVIFVKTADEPTAEGIDMLVEGVGASGHATPCAVVGIGGGITLDTAKAVSNLLTNGGHAADYQGWDLVRVPGVFKIGIPTISGTGAEATRTCVMTNARTGLKLGMNSDFTVYNQLILDPDLTATVPRDQYFYTGMDAYIHCVESLAGSYRNAIGDAYSRETINLCRQVFLGEDMKSPAAREQLMVASYLGGCAIASSYVGLVHPFSAGLSVVLGLHHCAANCIVMRAMTQFYPQACDEFWTMVERQRVAIPEGVCRGLTEAQYQALIDATVVHQKPLTNALGADFRKVLTDERVVDLFQAM